MKTHSYTVDPNIEPFPHTIIQGYFNDEQLHTIEKKLKALGPQNWYQKDQSFVKKSSINDPLYLRQKNIHDAAMIMEYMQEKEFVEKIERLIGVSKLMVDPTFKGAGYHRIDRGGFLNMHSDFNWHEGLMLDRRVNAILFLNSKWEDQWKGHLVLKHVSKGEEKLIVPSFNKLVIFESNDTTVHGHPEKLECPEDESRLSLSMYYYTDGRPDWQKSQAHTTIYHEGTQPVPCK